MHVHCAAEGGRVTVGPSGTATYACGRSFCDQNAVHGVSSPFVEELTLGSFYTESYRYRCPASPIMHSFLLPSLILAWGASAANTIVPTELYSSVIQQKVNATAQVYNATTPVYPEYTKQPNEWDFFNANTWTTGFFPTTLYALSTRASLCGTNDREAWLDLGRQWIVGEIPVEIVNTLEHDVGFVSFPFVEEYLL